MGNYASKVIAIAEAEVGYLEKASNSQLDSKTANAGKNNYTKYARDLDAISGFYNGKKNGYPWCDVWTDWCFVKAFGVETAKELLCQPSKSYGAGCGSSASYYKQKGRFYTKNPKVGDQIFFWDSNKTKVAHTGLVYKVTATSVYTIEGNTSGATGVVDNGGSVCKKSYSLKYYRIYGYGRPSYDVEPVDTKIDSVKEVQTWLNKTYSAGLVVDGLYGSKTKAALIKVLQKAIGVTDDGVYGPKTKAAIKVLKKGCTGVEVKVLQGLLVCNGYTKAYVDGDFGVGTYDAVIAYQRKMNLKADGEAGRATFNALCK